jgi:hypothetical protein
LVDQGKKAIDLGNSPTVFVVGCKKDLETKVAVDGVLAFCYANGFIYRETSAKTGFETS